MQVDDHDHALIPISEEVENLSTRAKGREGPYPPVAWRGTAKAAPDMRGRLQRMANLHEMKTRATHSAAGDHDKKENRHNIYPDILGESFTYTILFLSPWQPQKVNTINLILLVMTDLKLKS